MFSDGKKSENVRDCQIDYGISDDSVWLAGEARCCFDLFLRVVGRLEDLNIWSNSMGPGAVASGKEPVLTQLGLAEGLGVWDVSSTADTDPALALA